MPKLTAAKVKALKEPGMHGDGSGLYLRVGSTGAKSWVLRVVVHGRRRDLGLGSAALVTLGEARETARRLRKIAREGGDPDSERKRESMTFEEAARRVHAQLLPTWKNAKHSSTWISSIETYANPVFGKRPIETVNSADVLRALGPLWTSRAETARRLKQRIATIFDWAKGAGHYPHENPVNGIKKALPVVKGGGKHLAAMPWRGVPGFVDDLARRKGISARTLEFLILTAARSGEARGARWAEIDWDARAWVIPAERMKAGKPHRVPLSDAAMAILEQMRGLDPVLVFPSPVRAKDGSARPQSDAVFVALLKRMGREGFVPHGFRSSFRDWATEFAHADREVAEAALAHTVGNATERAYARSDLFERRRALMDTWAAFVTGEHADNVVPLARAK